MPIPISIAPEADRSTSRAMSNRDVCLRSGRDPGQIGNWVKGLDPEASRCIGNGDDKDDGEDVELGEDDRDELEDRYSTSSS